MNELLEKVPSRYQLVNVVAARARKIATRAEREELMLEDKPVSIAIREIAEGKLEEEEALAEEFGDLEEEDLLPEEDTEEEAPAEDEEE
jgi:DNA-directed RNA polymerase subunit omega